MNQVNNQDDDRDYEQEGHRGVNLISDALPFSRLWYLEVSDAIEYAKFRSRSHDAVIHVYDAAGNVIETHEHEGEFKETRRPFIFVASSVRSLEPRTRCTSCHQL